MPNGLYYEHARNRWRVRLYYQQRMVWRSYHYCREEAEKALSKAQEYRLKLVKSGQLKTLNKPPKNVTDLL